MNKKTQEEFIEHCRIIHKNKYDYSITLYTGGKNKIKYICPKHGVILQNAHSHESGHGCKKCSIEKNAERNHYTKEEFIQKSSLKHGDKYDYSLVVYEDSQTKIPIICHKKYCNGKEHGVFYQMPYSHIAGFGCPKCYGRNKNTDVWIEEAKMVYPDGMYTFEKTDYKHARDKVIVTCSKHGDFLTNPRDFLRGHGCPKCGMSFLEREVEKVLSEKQIVYLTQKKFPWSENLIVDFYLPDKKVVIECQGEQHFKENPMFDKRETLKDRQKRDERKKKLCNENGIEVFYYMDEKHMPYSKHKDVSFSSLLELQKRVLQ